MSAADQAASIEHAIRGSQLEPDVWNIDPNKNAWRPLDITGGNGSSNIAVLRHVNKLSDETHYHGGVKEETWEATMGYCRLPLYDKEVVAGNVYGNWIDYPMEATRLWAKEVGRIDVFNALTRRTEAILVMTALGAVDVVQKLGTPHPTPFNSWPKSAGAVQRAKYATCFPGLTRGHISTEINGSRKTNGRWNSITMMEDNSYGIMLAWKLGIGGSNPSKMSGWGKTWTKAMMSRWGAGSVWNPVDEYLLETLRIVVETPEALDASDWQYLANKLTWGLGPSHCRIGIEFGIHEDGQRWMLARDSIDNGSTGFVSAIVVRPDGYRQWLAHSQPTRQQEQGVHIQARFEGDRIVSYIDSLKKPPRDYVEHTEITGLGSPLVAHLRLNRDGGKVLAYEPPTIEPPVPPTEPPPPTQPPPDDGGYRVINPGGTNWFYDEVGAIMYDRDKWPKLTTCKKRNAAIKKARSVTRKGC